MFDNLFPMVGAMWVVVPLVTAMAVFGVVVVGFDAQAMRALGRRS